MKLKLMLAVATALAVACSAWLGFMVGRSSRPPLNLTITVSGDIVGRDGEGIYNGITATINDVEFLGLGPIVKESKR